VEEFSISSIYAPCHFIEVMRLQKERREVAVMLSALGFTIQGAGSDEFDILDIVQIISNIFIYDRYTAFYSLVYGMCCGWLLTTQYDIFDSG
tara:strand:+ start:260 stop:535 length:276 start_codon:yes stop_codon:yes gene_type:complete